MQLVVSSGGKNQTDCSRRRQKPRAARSTNTTPKPRAHTMAESRPRSMEWLCKEGLFSTVAPIAIISFAQKECLGVICKLMGVSRKNEFRHQGNSSGLQRGPCAVAERSFYNYWPMKKYPTLMFLKSKGQQVKKEVNWKAKLATCCRHPFLTFVLPELELKDHCEQKR